MANGRRRVTQIDKGMPVFSGDGRQLGRLDDIDPSALQVGTNRIPMGAVERITAEGIYLDGDVAWPELATTEPSDEGNASAADRPKRHKSVRVPIAEERLRVETRPTEGEVEVRKTVEEAEQVVRVALKRGEVEVQRVPLNRQLDAPVGQRMEGDWLIVPVVEEVLVVEKRLVLKEEIRIRTTPAEREEEVRGRVRREHVEVVPAGATRVNIVDGAADGVKSRAPEEPGAAGRERRTKRSATGQGSA